jgi:hypothetical protein
MLSYRRLRSRLRFWRPRAADASAGRMELGAQKRPPPTAHRIPVLPHHLLHRPLQRGDDARCQDPCRRWRVLDSADAIVPRRPLRGRRLRRCPSPSGRACDAGALSTAGALSAELPVRVAARPPAVAGCVWGAGVFSSVRTRRSLKSTRAASDSIRVPSDCMSILVRDTSVTSRCRTGSAARSTRSGGVRAPPPCGCIPVDTCLCLKRRDQWSRIEQQFHERLNSGGRTAPPPRLRRLRRR